MTRAILCALIAVVLAACSSPTLVYDPKDPPGMPANGSVQPLRDLVPSDGRPVTLVFVHGVGDHCPGYALDPRTGWLNGDAMAGMGLSPVTGGALPKFINVGVFMGGKSDARSGVWYATSKYALRVPGMVKEVPVDAIEITWSPLTQWIKSNQLGYDSPSVTPVVGGAPNGCTQPPDMNIPATTEPPSRLLLDRNIKESVFDRSLSDAILYSGTYGPTMERGVAEALCHAVTGTAANVKCAWPTRLRSAESTTKYFFVTHSLGSRMIYDVFLSLMGYQGNAKGNPFTEKEVHAAKPFIASMLADTQAFYMMANQLTLLGLANVPKDARSGNGIHPFDFPGPIYETAPLELADKTPAPGGEAPKKVFDNVLEAIGVARATAVSAFRSDSARLQIVAFNDTNDLLTWHIPSWYVNGGRTSSDGRPRIDVVNVFVQNTAKLFVIESPAPAHQDYFKNSAVWGVIACGASAGVALPCP